ncbi:MAG: hypothetical protein WC289_04625 [Patescibacteria group bacterium]|jgi:hypothetical protein
MTKRIFVLGILLGIVAIFGYVSVGRAATPFVSNMRIDTGTHEHLRLCWDLPDTVTTNTLTVTIKYYTTDPNSITTASPTAFGGLNGSLCYNIIHLSGDTAYTFFVEYTSTGSQETLMGYSDYDAIAGKIISSTFTAWTPKEGLKATSVDKKYVRAGERFRVYFENLGAPTDLGNAYLGPRHEYAGIYDVGTHTGNYYTPQIISIGSNYVELEAPSYDVAKNVQWGGPVYFSHLWLDEGNYKAEPVILINSDAEVTRSVESGYTGSLYRYLMNSTTFRYNSIRTSASNGLEGARMIWMSNYLKSIGKGVDGLWSVVLSNSVVYGGYTEDEIKHEIQYGPGCVHATISELTWKLTADYQRCMANSLK